MIVHGLYNNTNVSKLCNSKPNLHESSRQSKKQVMAIWNWSPGEFCGPWVSCFGFLQMVPAVLDTSSGNWGRCGTVVDALRLRVFLMSAAAPPCVLRQKMWLRQRNLDFLQLVSATSDTS